MDKVNQQDYKTSTVAKKTPPAFPGWELLIALGFVVWRLVAGYAGDYWKDWILIASFFWIYTGFQSNSRAWPVVTVTTMAYLLGIYLLGVLPHALAVLGFGA
jgi:hypothetical protein